MKRDFFKKNWVYIALFCLIVIINVGPRFGKKGTPQEKAKTEEKAERPEEESLFVEFDEAQARSKKIESTLRKSPPQYAFYIFLNLFILFIFFIGLIVDGYFLFGKYKKKSLFERAPGAGPPAWTIGEVFKMVILALTFGYVFFILLGFFIGVSEAAMRTKFQFYKNENFRMIFDTIVLDAILFVIILNFLWNIHKRRLSSLGFAGKNIRKNIFYGIYGYLGVMPLVFTIGVLIYIILNILKLKPPPQPIVGLFLAEENMPLVFASSVIASVFGPFIEEIFFRGVMYNAVKRKIGIFWAIFITSVLFSFLHTHAMTYFLVGFVPIAILGVALAYLYEKTASLVPSITLHVLNNLGSVIMVFVFKYFRNLVN